MTTAPTAATLTTVPVAVWARKDVLIKVGGKGHVTIGSVVTHDAVGGRVGLERRLPRGVRGKVVESGSASPRRAQAAVGTKAAMRVLFDVPLADVADGAYFIETGKEDGIAVGHWQVVVNHAWLVGAPEEGDTDPAMFDSVPAALGALDTYLRLRGGR